MFTKYDKAGAAAIGAAIGSVAAAFTNFSTEQDAAIVVVITMILTWWVPNKEA